MQAATANPALDLVAAAVTLAQELVSGHAACLPWSSGTLEATLERLRRLLVSARWIDLLQEAARSPDAMTRWRAGWAQRAVGTLPPVPPPGQDGYDHLAVHVVVPDPALSGPVETRLLVNGRPVVAKAFRAGTPYPPELLLDDLGAAEEPREVRLAEAYRTEGCCGALYVTIARDDGTVVWRDWRDSSGQAVTLEPACFAADAYEEVIGRAVGDRGWEWRARTLAWEVLRLLREDPGLLSAWQCELHHVHAAVDRQDEIEIIFLHRRRPSPLEDWTDDEPWLQFSLTVPLDGTDVNSQAARLVNRLRGDDPKAYAEIISGGREFAEMLGFPWPDCYEEE
ncbi:hypothetical protein [Sphaerisporangium fuscum]|uniref:hypothetical protein n=1 Tax=Sphaerisporangium fuscum TaxID=2835868 RepID=UPI001BDD033A|nr:hypothetical protein [Sphaerisporangium fuscum]